MSPQKEGRKEERTTRERKGKEGNTEREGQNRSLPPLPGKDERGKDKGKRK